MHGEDNDPEEWRIGGRGEMSKFGLGENAWDSPVEEGRGRRGGAGGEGEGGGGGVVGEGGGVSEVGG